MLSENAEPPYYVVKILVPPPKKILSDIQLWHLLWDTK